VPVPPKPDPKLAKLMKRYDELLEDLDRANQAQRSYNERLGQVEDKLRRLEDALGGQIGLRLD
jgi:hypothetical protein